VVLDVSEGMSVNKRAKQEFDVEYRRYATIARRNMRCLVTAGKHVNNIRAIASQPPITTIEGLLEALFSIGSSPRLHNDDTSQAAGIPVWRRDRIPPP
jgi:hypothetical protein